MKEIPEWIIKVVESEDLKCRQCKKLFNIDDLMSIGIQDSSNPPHDDTLCIGMFCSDCKELIIFELKEMTLIDFAFELLDQETSNNKIKKKIRKEDNDFILNKRSRSYKNRKKKSKITLKEIRDIKKFLAPKDLKHEDLLIAMGMLPEEIIKYNYKRQKGHGQ